MKIKFVLEYGLVAFVLLCVHLSQSIKLGLFAGDYKTNAAPITMRKYSHNAPVFINIKPSSPILRDLSKMKSKIPNLPLGIKPPRIQKKNIVKPVLPKSAALRLPNIPPLLPRIPMFPIYIPPRIPSLPIFLPKPILPAPLNLPLVLLPLKKPFKLSKSKISPKSVIKLLKVKNTFRMPNTLNLPRSSPLSLPKVKPVKVPLVTDLAVKGKKKMLKKLLDIKRNGSITTAEYLRFKRLLGL